MENQKTTSNQIDQRICVMGLGYVGLTLAAALADVDFDVMGIEIRTNVLEMLRQGRAHFHEPGMETLLKRVMRRNRMTVYEKIPHGGNATAYIITVGTPLNAEGVPRLDMVETVSREIAAHLKDGDLVILRSTVMIGTTRNVVAPILAATGKKFDLAFCPERTLEGIALKELRMLPQIVGGYTHQASIRAAQIFQMLTPTVVKVPSLETAEMIKMVDNVQRDVSFAFSNEIARVCNATGVSAHDVIMAGKLGYPRTNLPLPGLVGGPCLEKDTYIFAEGLKTYSVAPELSLLARKVNEEQPEEVVSFLKKTLSSLPHFPAKPKISLLGIAFKGRPATDDLRGTMARPVFNSLQKHFPGADFGGYDSVVSRADIEAFGLRPVPSIAEAFRGAHLVLILNSHPDFASMPVEDLAADMADPSMVYDFWNNFRPEDLHLPRNVGFAALGSHGLALVPGRA